MQHAIQQMGYLSYQISPMPELGRPRGWHRNKKSNVAGMAAAVAVHALAILALWLFIPVGSMLKEAAPMMVSLVTADSARPQSLPVPMPVKLPEVMPRQIPVPDIALRVPAPEILPPAAAPTAPATISYAKAAEAPAPAILAVIPPRFDAAYLSNPAPAYPPLARARHEEGRVLLQVLVSANGTAARVEIKTSSGSSMLDKAALETVKTWRFVAARQGDTPIEAWVVVPMLFTLKA
jgi:protein TonB